MQIPLSFQEKSEAIATYALCGYSNVGTISTMLGFIAIIAPNKFGRVTSVFPLMQLNINY